MKISKILTSLALLGAMGNAVALTATATLNNPTDPNHYSFNDGVNLIATLTLEHYGNDQKYLRFIFDESSSYLASNLLVNYTSDDVNLGRNEYEWTAADRSLNRALFGPNAEFLSATLTYNAALTTVPEPESIALLLAGLGLMGAIARRRNNKQA
jgi:hypothetical protein